MGPLEIADTDAAILMHLAASVPLEYWAKPNLLTKLTE